jgi:hypothetical protein
MPVPGCFGRHQPVPAARPRGEHRDGVPAEAGPGLDREPYGRPAVAGGLRREGPERGDGDLGATGQHRPDAAALSGRHRPRGRRRTAAQLWQAAGGRKAAREKAEEQRRREEEARQAAARAASYARRLDELATRVEAAWQEAAALIETKRPRDYDLAVTLLRDLQALADRQGNPAAFTKRFLELRGRHQRKPSLLDRLDKAGLPR